jgi:hypothetical protein
VNTTYYARWNAAAAADDYGNTFSAATAVSLNATKTGTINTGSDADYFRFTTTTAGDYTISSTVSGGLDSKGYLYNSGQTQVAYNDDFSGLAFGFRVSLSANSTYYLQVCSYGGTTGNYSFVITPPAAVPEPIPDDYGNTRETAVSLIYIDNGSGASAANAVPVALNVNIPNNIPLGTPVLGNIGSPPGFDRHDLTDVDCFAFRVPQTASYTMDVRGVAPSVLIEGGLRTDAQGEIAVTRYSNSNGFRMTQTLCSGVIYYLTVRSYQSSYYGNYQFVLNYTYPRTGVSYLDEFLELAESQLGTIEYADRARTTPGINNYTIYGEDFGMDGAAWCVMFMNWCAKYAGVPLDIIPWNHTAKSSALRDWYKNEVLREDPNRRRFAAISASPYRPKAGDLMLFSAHTAIVVADVVNADGVSGTTYTIDGNSGDYGNVDRDGYQVQYNARRFEIENGIRVYKKNDGTTRSDQPTGFAINYGTSYGIVPARYVDNTRGASI